MAKTKETIVWAITWEGLGIISEIGVWSDLGILFLDHLGQMSRNGCACAASLFTNHDFSCLNLNTAQENIEKEAHPSKL